MPSPTLSQAKNTIRRALWRLVDRNPNKTEITRLWRHFQSECAYCGRPLIKGDRKAHIDHLDANRSVNRNHVSNRVLACNICNGDEKRDSDWEKFLAQKCGDDVAAYVIRSSKIREWQQQCGIPSEVDTAVIAEVERAVQECNAKLELECSRIRQLLQNARK
jgi:HNH endonuclease